MVLTIVYCICPEWSFIFTCFSEKKVQFDVESVLLVYKADVARWQQKLNCYLWSFFILCYHWMMSLMLPNQWSLILSSCPKIVPIHGLPSHPCSLSRHVLGVALLWIILRRDLWLTPRQVMTSRIWKFKRIPERTAVTVPQSHYLSNTSI